MSGQHAMLSPSGAARWMSCPGSVALEADYPESSNEYSDEGTAAHAVAAMCLTEGRPAAAYIGRRVDVGPHRTYEFREDMAEPVQAYVDTILQFQGQPKFGSVAAEPFAGHELFVEIRVPVSHITGEEGAEGTSDVVIITEDQEEIQVHDLKFGRGVRVNAERNPQGMLYALGALEKYDVLGSFKRVRIVIHQPRLDSVSEWDCTVDELRAFAEEARDAAKVAMLAFEHRANWMGSSSSYLSPSTEACKFCKAKATCPAKNAQVQEVIGAEFEELAAEGADIMVVQQVVFNDAAQLAVKMLAIDQIESWCKAVRAEVERRLLAGDTVPEYKIVQGRQGNRAYTSVEEAEQLLKSFRLKHDEMYDSKVKSPTAIEKLLKESPKRWKKVEALITRSPGALSVAHVSDKRPAVEVQPVADAFEVITETEDLI
jgi:hypothetical protein